MTKQRIQQQPKPGLWENELTQKQVMAAATWLGEQSRNSLIENMRAAILETPIHSPIEAAFNAWWDAVDKVEAFDLSQQLSLIPQPTVTLPSGRVCRPDFTVFPGDTDTLFEADELGVRFPNLAVELDGHDFHERTKEQVTERNQRDRELTAAGWRVFHFSGSELVRDPLACVHEVRVVAEAAWMRVQRDLDQRRSHEALTAGSPVNPNS